VIPLIETEVGKEVIVTMTWRSDAAVPYANSVRKDLPDNEVDLFFSASCVTLRA